ncbi:TetR/AcrR family transcriptional regulator [Reinekea blandensis]|uniref:Putative TetR-family transcriptional regulator n=1 Tax=Reinekea blandensis MED297 TaxID=314283 RepID=A4B925_9GAMM|nr:TetR/AcrR family transcriptional regulator [Reinekea blandensis]EAR11126.1 putative TetR-family transcriptional regulator [Reinekea sp. MED297] [Reinekea blandensis MED297]
MGDTREQLEDRAEHYIRTGGFHSFSFRDLAKDLGIKSASVHYHFPTKSDLGIAVVRRYNDRFANALSDPSSPTMTTADHIRRYMMMFYTEMKQSQKMCLCAVLSVEQLTLSEDMRSAVDEFYTLNLNWLTRTFQLTSQSQMTPTQSNQRASQVFATMQGALIGASVRQDTQYFELAARALFKDLFDKDLRFSKTSVTD